MAKEWKKTYTSNGQTVNLKTPIACCKSDSPEDGGSGTGTVVDKNCAEHPTDTNSNWNTVIRLFINFYFTVILNDRS